jgi:hypothetical protein
MAPLSRKLNGLILKPYLYVSHLDGSGKTVDADLEKVNFKHVGTLAEIWNSVVIDGHPLVADYIDPIHSELVESQLNVADQNWFAENVRSSQYFLQIVKCNDMICCAAPRSSEFLLLLLDLCLAQFFV